MELAEASRDFEILSVTAPGHLQGEKNSSRLSIKNGIKNKDTKDIPVLYDTQVTTFKPTKFVVFQLRITIDSQVKNRKNPIWCY